LCRPVAWKNSQIDICASIGVTLLTRAVRQGPAQFFAEADSALYVAKGAGRNAIRVFNENIEGMRFQEMLPRDCVGHVEQYSERATGCVRLD